MVCGAPGFSSKAKQLVIDPENSLFLSLASIWEIAIKCSIGKLKIADPIESFIPTVMQANDIEQLDVTFRHVARTASLPFHHRDPFDRLLVCQVAEERLTLISADPIFDRYQVPRIW
jgi:PIN domain nuclease of toxin-antitoxin system